MENYFVNSQTSKQMHFEIKNSELTVHISELLLILSCLLTTRSHTF